MDAIQEYSSECDMFFKVTMRKCPQICVVNVSNILYLQVHFAMKAVDVVLKNESNNFENVATEGTRIIKIHGTK